MSYINPATRSEHYPQKATYWSQKKQDGYGGETWEIPILINCRWEDYSEETLSVAYRVESETVTSGAHVFTTFPLIEGGYLFLGETTEANPTRLKVGPLRAYAIRKTSGTPGVRGGYMEHVSFL
jgi:hypothetical protein